MIKSQLSILIVFVSLLFAAGAVHAQATRTWVSGVGDDVNPCSRTAPCKTFAGAISKTAAGGEISVIDPGGYGAVTITKSITIDGQGQLTGILSSSGANGITINAGVADVVTIRNLTINGAGTGGSGIRYLQANQVIVDSVAISGVTGSGIEVGTTNLSRLIVTNSTIAQSGIGVHISASSPVSALLDRTSLRGNTIGVDAVSGTVDIINSTISQNSTYGVYAEGGTIDVESSMLSGNATALQSTTGSLVRMSNSSLYNNMIGIGCGGGTIASAQNNRKGGNTGGSAPVCAPNATIAIQ
jgi:hypothetical protein